MIKKIVDNVFKKIKNIYHKYPLTIICITLMTLFLAIFLDDIDDDIIDKIMQFLLAFSFGSLFAEIFFKDNKRFIFYILFAILSIMFVWFSDSSNEILVEISSRYLITYILVIITVCFYKLYKNSKKTLSNYLVSAFANVFKTTVIYLVLVLGLLIITEVFSYLILSDYDFDIVLRIQFLLMGLFYIPNLLDDFTNVTNDNYPFIKVLIHYTLLSLIILAFIIIYLYILKIIITWEFPSNQIFRIITVLFLFYLPIYIMNDYYKEDILWKINSKLPILFIPFVALQIYSLGVRIINNGITNIRYLGIMVIIFEIVHLLIYFKKMNDDYLFFMMTGIIIVSVLIPFINMYNVSNLSQSIILDNLLLKDNYTSQEKSKLYSTYNYLNSSYTGKRYLEKYSDEVIEKLNSLKEYLNYQYHYIYANKDVPTIDVSNYQTLYNINYSNNYLANKITLNKEDVKVDITDNIMAYIENANNIEEYFENHNEFVIDDVKIILNYLSIEYEEDDIRSLSFTGFILK